MRAREGLLSQCDGWPAPAKLNLMLRIVGRRPDGYHLLQSVFQFLDVGDCLRFQPNATGLIRRIRGPETVAAEADLVVRAAKRLQKATGTPRGVDIQVDKHLPMGGGLGGGSSDAATTLVALNRLWDLRLGVDELAGLGLALGADVPVFVRGQAAWAEGVGEKLTPVELPEPWYLVLAPECHVSTPAVFAAPDLTRNSPRITIADFFAGSEANDCLDVVLRDYPPVRDALEALEAYAPARLTGTGACVFAVFPSFEAAEDAWRGLRTQYRGFVARGMNRSPLLDRKV